MAENETSAPSETPSATQSESKKAGSSWISVAVDYGPLLVFLAAYRYFAPEDPNPVGEIYAIVRGTAAFMFAAMIALAVSKWRLGKISPMLWFSTILIVGFGALTIFFGDPTFVQIKPTIIYAAMGAALIIGYFMGRALLQILLEAAFDGVDEAGWLKLSRNWGIFFLALAAINEGIRFNYNADNGGFETWLWAKFWVFMPLTFLFTITQIPMLLKHGLDVGQDDEESKEENEDKAA